eukprot:gnl/Dysnectes_brevis/7172_a11775_401.p1 GENE.gnl/Dysnectes_brevis/7172_a11775_401~~gnl/Dysnectes_brevis/7172_a11775_401.p1  ORF type:complete len:321 (+),score=-22.23 gnl/Dysnectes_brevis/7172_a11775_401:22-984(+)
MATHYESELVSSRTPSILPRSSSVISSAKTKIIHFDPSWSSFIADKSLLRIAVLRNLVIELNKAITNQHEFSLLYLLSCSVYYGDLPTGLVHPITPPTWSIIFEYLFGILKLAYFAFSILFLISPKENFSLNMYLMIGWVFFTILSCVLYIILLRSPLDKCKFMLLTVASSLLATMTNLLFAVDVILFGQEDMFSRTMPCFATLFVFDSVITTISFKIRKKTFNGYRHQIEGIQRIPVMAAALVVSRNVGISLPNGAPIALTVGVGKPGTSNACLINTDGMLDHLALSSHILGKYPGDKQTPWPDQWWIRTDVWVAVTIP